MRINPPNSSKIPIVNPPVGTAAGGAGTGVAVFKLPAGRGVTVGGAAVAVEVAVFVGRGVAESTPVTLGVTVGVKVIVAVGVNVDVGVRDAVGVAVTP